MNGILIPGFTSNEEDTPVSSPKPEAAQKFTIPPVVWLILFVIVGVAGFSVMLED